MNDQTVSNKIRPTYSKWQGLVTIENKFSFVVIIVFTENTKYCILKCQEHEW